jgi:hypothetical protein
MLTFEKPYEDMTLEERRARMTARYWFAHGPCADCPFDGVNVIHDPPSYRARDPYHCWNRDVPFHPFREAEPTP